MQPCLFVPQREDARDQRPVVVFAGVRAAPDPGTPRQLAQVAPRGKGEEGRGQGPRQRDRVHVAQPALLRRHAGGRAHELRQARHLLLVVQHQGPGRFVVQHVLPEGRVAGGQLLGDLPDPRLRWGWQARAGEDEVEVHALQQAHLLGVQAEDGAPLVQIRDPLEQAGMQVDGAVVRGQHRGQLPLHFLQLGRGLRRTEIVEHHAHAPQPARAAVEGGQRVVESGRRGVAGDRIERRAVLLHRQREGRLEMAGRDAVEGCQAVGCGRGERSGFSCVPVMHPFWPRATGPGRPGRSALRP
ncbi:hypothetical protein [Ramlibacter montanisoli]|uniref:hypothetical protein n=1 Tax=Ramlibacter montanisoli TaxID=2732512 RepID=UPI002814DEC3|nr:hypothetical protein [Ramlibacter montanisoli]